MLPAIAILSAAVLAYEVLLMRLLAIVQWHHFAYMVISIALLGFGASGSFLFLTQKWLKPRFIFGFAANALLFGASALAGFALSGRVPFNALEVVWDPGQLLYLLVLYMLFTVPFFFGANCIGLAFICFGKEIGRVYRWNLIGSGVGALAVVGALFVFPPSDVLRLTMGLGIAAAGLVCLERKLSKRQLLGAALLAVAVLLPTFVPNSWIALILSEYKGLSIALRVPGTEIVGVHSSPLGLLTVVRSPTIPFRHAPGLSLNNTVEPPPQLGVFTDGDALSVITRYEGRREALAYLDYTTSALPYHLLQNPKVLILGAGGGADVLQAIYHGASRIDAVELNHQFLRLVERDHAAFAGDLYARPEVLAHAAEPRAFVARSKERWNLIQIPLLDAGGASAAGVQSLTESYVYTVEAFQQYLAHLEPGGYLAATRWFKIPPRDSLKLFVTALLALEKNRVPHSSDHVALVRGWNTTTLLVKNGVISLEEIGAIRDFAEERSFDLAYYAGMGSEEANRFNVLQEPYLYDGATALVGPHRGDFLERYKFDLKPASDDRPYFFDFFKWRHLSEFIQLRTRGGAALLEWGYLILLATLVQAAALSVVFILLPLWLRDGQLVRFPDRGRILAYFFALGLAFLFVEISFIQRFILFLGHPIYSVAVVICSFLVFAGLGSGLASRFQSYLDDRREIARRFRISAIDISVSGIAALSLVYLLLLPLLFRWLMTWPDPAKVIVSILIIAPLAFAMGMPFPLGLSRVSARAPELVPWAWGVNGCASVLSAVLAMILAIHFGFTAVAAIAAGLYLVAAAVFRTGLAGRLPAAT